MSVVYKDNIGVYVKVRTKTEETIIRPIVHPVVDPLRNKEYRKRFEKGWKAKIQTTNESQFNLADNPKLTNIDKSGLYKLVSEDKTIAEVWFKQAV